MPQRPAKQKDLMYNFAYYPVLFESETELKEVFNALSKDGIHPRRYFYPSLNKLPYLENTLDCPISEDIASRIACLPLFIGLELGTIEKICKIIRGVLQSMTNFFDKIFSYKKDDINTVWRFYALKFHTKTKKTLLKAITQQNNYDLTELKTAKELIIFFVH